MKEILKHLKPIQNMIVLALLVLSFILATQTSVLAQSLCNGQVPTILGTQDHDFIKGTAGPDVIQGLGGNDVIEGKGGNDVICGGDGHDVISGGDGDDTLIGGEGADHLSGNDGDDYISGGKGHDVLCGGPGDDELWGNWGNDTLFGSSGYDVLWGGTGPAGGTLNNNDTCYDALSSFIRGCEVFYGESTLLKPNFAPVPKTGRTISHDTGDDGDLQMGVPWPDPRFTDNGDGTVTDHLTGLIWLRNADCFGETSWADALAASNNLADGQCGLSDGSSPGDWRLPNLRELHSLIEYGQKPGGGPFVGQMVPATGLASGHPFQTVANDNYYTSTVQMLGWMWGPDYWAVNPSGGVGYVNGQCYMGVCEGRTWPVRGGN